MASNKNQHYVPQCYLRLFSIDENLSATNLFNIDREKFIECAPIKNQCSKNYFYGDDLFLEKALQPIEGKYSSTIRLLTQPNFKLNDEHRIFLKHFWLLQYMRTEAASRRTIEMTEEMGDVAGMQPQDYRLSLDEAVQGSMRVFVKSIGAIDDLKVCLIKNKTNIDFITSDDPAVLTNRWHLNNKRTIGTSFGLGSAGSIIILPLTPRILCLGYDGDIYNMQHKDGWVAIRNKADINALNEHQFLNCRANIFAQSKNSKSYILNFFEKIKKYRPEFKHKIHYAVLDSEEKGQKKYIVVDRKQAEKHEEALIHCQSVAINPSSWPKQIKWRSKKYVYSNGSGLGYIRKTRAGTMPHDGLKRIKA